MSFSTSKSGVKGKKVSCDVQLQIYHHCCSPTYKSMKLFYDIKYLHLI